MFVLFAIGLIVLALTYTILSRKQDYWSKNGIRTFPAPNLFRVLFFDKEKTDAECRFYKKLKASGLPYAGVYEFGRPSLVVMDLELRRQVFIKSFDHFTDVTNFKMKNLDPHLHYQLFNMRGQEWKDMRSTLTPSFTTGRIRRMMHIFESGANEMINAIRRHQESQKSLEVNVHSFISRFTLHVISSAAFGVETDVFQNPDSLFMKYVPRLSFDLPKVFKLIFFMTLPKVAKFLGVKFLDPEADKFVTTLVQSCISHRENTGEKRDDFLQLMIDAKHGKLKSDETEESGDAGKVQLTDDMIVSQALLFLNGGFDTIEGLLNFALYELALVPEIQETLYEELRAASEKEGGLNYETINSLEYLGMVISEVSRKHPIAIRLQRICTKPFQIPGSEVIIPKDTALTFPIYSIHHDPEYWPDPEQFDPLRFTKDKVAARHPMTYVPFGHGPRSCIGSRFALVEARVALAKLILEFKYEPCEKTDIPLKISRKSFNRKPAGNVWLRVTPRQ